MRFLVSALLCLLVYKPVTVSATQFDQVKVVDKDFIQIHFRDGNVLFVDNGKGAAAFRTTDHDAKNNFVERFGAPLDTAKVSILSDWLITSTDDPAYPGNEIHPLSCYRKSKLNGMAEKEWKNRDYHYEVTREHWLYIRLPHSMKQGKHYTIHFPAGINSDKASAELEFDVNTSSTEALHINLAGYRSGPGIKAADLYCWMGDGGARDYSSFSGKKIWVYNTGNKTMTPVGNIRFWKKEATEAGGYDLLASDVMKADFSSLVEPGTYRLVVEDVGCSEDFEVGQQVYHDPFMVSTRGFFYMRIGQDSVGGIRPVPRRPLFIPGKSPQNTRVILTSMQPWHSQWRKFTHGDQWDQPKDWAAFALPGKPENIYAYGGHADALDWDRHLGHVSIIYDMLLPFVLTNGALQDDDLGIAESGNGIPDILDEAKYEVDFWLRLRNGQGYGHGVTNPYGDSVLYQAGNTAIAAWANAANASMLASCFRRAGLTVMMNTYRDSALAAYKYASRLSDPGLQDVQDVGDGGMSGLDFKLTAAAYLYDLTGDESYEKTILTECPVSTDTSVIESKKQNLLWMVAGYLFTYREKHNALFLQHLKNSLIHEARIKEALYAEKRPSRRATDEDKGYFKTEHNVQRCLIAHALLPQGPEKDYFSNAITLEADYGLGRNPLNMVLMTTAGTPMAKYRSIENIYTSGRDDGSPGLHPGHTPYLNTDNWGQGMVMHQPGWMLAFCYPSYSHWPKAEGYFNTRYVWSHSEFTPQQTMRGKMALYGYLYALGKLNGSQK